KRRGGVAPLVALLLVPLLGMAAFAVDMGYICLVKTDLQTAADAAALAGAEKLQTLFVQYNLPNQGGGSFRSTILSTATGLSAGSPRDTAKTFAAYNTAGSVNINLRDEDVTVGFLSADGTFSTSYSGFPNSISVIARRDHLKNNPVSLFFARVFG